MSHADRYSRKPRAQGGARGRSRKLTAWIAGGAVLLIIAALAFLFLRDKPPQVTDPMDKSIGSPDAPFTIVEYGDFQCLACKTFALNMEPKIIADYVDTGKARFVFRHMAFIGKESVLAAVASECANEQGRFWDYYARVYQGQAGENLGAFSEENLAAFAQELGLNMNQYNRCFNSGKYLEKVQNETAEADELEIQQTPSILVNGEIIEWGGDLTKLDAELKRIINE